MLTDNIYHAIDKSASKKAAKSLEQVHNCMHDLMTELGKIVSASEEARKHDIAKSGMLDALVKENAYKNRLNEALEEKLVCNGIEVYPLPPILTAGRSDCRMSEDRKDMDEVMPIE